MFIPGVAVLAVIAAAVLSVVALGFVVPIWALIDCATGRSGTARKILWIVAMFLTGGLAAIAYACIARNPALKRTTIVSLLAIPTLVVVFVATGMTLPARARSLGGFAKSPIAHTAAVKLNMKPGTKPGAKVAATAATTASNAAGETVMQAGAPASGTPVVSRLADAAATFRVRREWPAAIAAYDSILKVTPNAPDILLARGDVKASACDSTGADHDFRSAIGGAIQRMNADSLDPEAIYWQGVGLGRLGDYMNARVMVRQAIHFDLLRGGKHSATYRRELVSMALDSASAGERKPGCRGNPRA